MATPALTPPPSQQDANNPPVPPSPPTAAPAPPKPNPQMNDDTEKVLNVVRTLTDLAQNYPAAAPHVRKINDEVRFIVQAIMQHQQASEPAAPPTA